MRALRSNGVSGASDGIRRLSWLNWCRRKVWGAPARWVGTSAASMAEATLDSRDRRLEVLGKRSRSHARSDAAVGRWARRRRRHGRPRGSFQAGRRRRPAAHVSKCVRASMSEVRVAGRPLLPGASPRRDNPSHRWHCEQYWRFMRAVSMATGGHRCGSAAAAGCGGPDAKQPRAVCRLPVLESISLQTKRLQTAQSKDTTLGGTAQRLAYCSADAPR